MIRRARQDGGWPEIMHRLPIDNFPISWAGSGRNSQEFCLGSEDGRIRLTNVDGSTIGETPAYDEHAEAVNGVAFAVDAIAVSSRADIIFWRSVDGNPSQRQPCAFPCGSHGVLALAGRRFIAPLGPTGLMLASMKKAQAESITISRIREPGRLVDYYRVIDLVADGTDLLACAVRSAGIAAIQLEKAGNGGQIDSLTFPGLDVVDVCALTDSSRSLVALARDGTLVLFKDVLSDRSPTTLKFKEIRGTAYRVFSVRENLLVLTSKALYVLDGVASRFLAGEDVSAGPTPASFRTLEAVDANLCGQRWLLVVVTDGVLRFDLDRLFHRSGEADTTEPTDSRPSTPVVTFPSWRLSREPAEVGPIS